MDKTVLSTYNKKWKGMEDIFRKHDEDIDTLFTHYNATI
jgi:hypothetical protein